MPLTHRFVRNVSYYATGPQQGSPPDGVIARGTRCELLGSKIGAYEKVRTEDNRTGYVDKHALTPIAKITATPIITYVIDKDQPDHLKAAAKTACNFWNRFIQARQSIVIQLGRFTANSNTIARAYEPFMRAGVMYGKVEFNTKYLSTFTKYQVAGTIAHEIGHTLGFGWETWASLFSETTGRFTPAAVQALPTLSKMRVERDGGAGTELSHWDEDTHTDELMTGYKDEVETLLPITIDVMRLLGHQVVESLPGPAALVDVLRSTESVIFSRQGDTETIDLDVQQITKLWEEIEHTTA